MDLHKLIGETRKITESELYDESGLPPAEPGLPPETEGPGMEGAEAEVSEAPEVTPELIQQLSADIPELADADQEELLKGLQAEMEHFDTVGGDVNLVAKITLDHLNEFPGQKYYTALEQMETELSSAEGQGAPEEPLAEEPAVEPEPEVSTEEPVAEPSFESKKKEVKK
jgi:Protein of unknown function (DUF5661)